MKRRSFFKSLCQAVAVVTVAPMAVAQATVVTNSVGYTNNIQIVRETMSCTGTEMTNVIWFEVTKKSKGWFKAKAGKPLEILYPKAKLIDLEYEEV